MFQVGIDEDDTNTGLPLQCAILCDIVRMEIKSTIKDESCLLAILFNINLWVVTCSA